MRCCANCIGDRVLAAQVIPTYSDEAGTCSYCQSKNVLLIEPIKLRDKFELLIDTVYIQAANGKSLTEHLKKDWDLFNHSAMDEANAQRLLADILDDGQLVREKFIPKEEGNSTNLDLWNNFKYNIKHKNRFFLNEKLDESLFRTLLASLERKPLEISTTWYRARIQESELIPLGMMGSPPEKLSTHGRANPAGIPYLYLATNPDTAISEIRPHTGQHASVATFTISDSLILIDLRNPRSTASPFIDITEEILILRNNISFMEHLGNELTRPVLPHLAATEYIPSQYLCEFIKKEGYDGVIYKSSVGTGTNLALFDQSNARPISVIQYYVARVAVNIETITELP